MGGFALSDIRTHQDATVNNTVMYWHRNRNRSAHNNPEINPRVCGLWTYKKGSILNDWR